MGVGWDVLASVSLGLKEWTQWIEFGWMLLYLGKCGWHIAQNRERSPVNKNKRSDPRMLAKV